MELRLPNDLIQKAAAIALITRKDVLRRLNNRFGRVKAGLK